MNSHAPITPDKTEQDGKNQFNSIRFLPAVLLLLFSATFLAGCGGHNTHQLVSNTTDCVICHSDEKVIFDNVLAPSSAVDVGSTVEVKTKYNAVYVSAPLFTSDIGNTYVPLVQKRVPAVNGVATITLDPGVWVLSVDKGETADSILVDSIPEIETTKKISL